MLLDGNAETAFAGVVRCPGPGAELSGSASDGAAPWVPRALGRGWLSPFFRRLVALLPHPTPQEEEEEEVPWR